jgi:hypothetical protein
MQDRDNCYDDTDEFVPLQPDDNDDGCWVECEDGSLQWGCWGIDKNGKEVIAYISSTAPLPPELKKARDKADDYQPPKRSSCSWPELLKRPHRVMLVDDLLFTAGVITLVADSGGGKTTLAIAVALTVATGGRWGDREIAQMPVYWLAGQGQEDLRAMYEGRMKKVPGCGQPQGRVFEDAVDFASEGDTKKFFREELEGKPPALIVIDALGDMIGTLNEKETRDMNLFYRNIWWMARKNKGVVLVLHHTGWVNDRERGAKAIRDNSDIVVQITKFDPGAGVVVLKHNKRRGGAMLKEFIFGVELVEVEGCKEAVPVVTGPKGGDGQSVAPPASNEVHARKLVEVMLKQFPEVATQTELETASGMKEGTFNRGFKWAREAEWLVGGGGRNLRYQLNPNGSWKAATSVSGEGATSVPGATLIERGVAGTLAPKEVTAMAPSWHRVGTVAPTSDAQAEEALAVTIDAEAILKKLDTR